ncbi:hypothetical protein ABID59_004490 [Bradyrhizobium sp. S3.3.6]|uniref:hypothetical protein n=1 Tax=Bradyrhizobium sp. S3.3.6 TaxID=3156429 RepID=UPI00339AF12E
MAKHEAEGESTRLLDLTRVLLITAAGTRAGISDRVQHLHQFSDSFVLRHYLGGSCRAIPLARMRGGAVLRPAPAFRSTEITQPRRRAGRRQSFLEHQHSDRSSRDISAPLRPAMAWSTTPKTPSISPLKYDHE